MDEEYFRMGKLYQSNNAKRNLDIQHGKYLKKVEETRNAEFPFDSSSKALKSAKSEVASLKKEIANLKEQIERIEEKELNNALIKERKAEDTHHRTGYLFRTLSKELLNSEETYKNAQKLYTQTLADIKAE